MVVRHTVDKQPLGGYGKFRERIRKSKVSENAPLGSGQHSGERDRKKRKKSQIFLTQVSGRQTQWNLIVACTYCSRKQEICEWKVQHPIKRIVTLSIYLVWLNENQPSEGWSLGQMIDMTQMECKFQKSYFLEPKFSLNELLLLL